MDDNGYAQWKDIPAGMLKGVLWLALIGLCLVAYAVRSARGLARG